MRTIVRAVDPTWGDAAETSIVCQVTTQEAGGPFPFNCMASDPELHGLRLWVDLTSGKYGPIRDYVAPSSKPAPAKRGPHVIA
jgi:hypothetical protein